MKNSIARGVLALTCAAVAVPGCASEQIYDGDPANWPAPDDSLQQPVQPYAISVERLLEFTDKGWGYSPPLPHWDQATVQRLAYEQAQMYIAGVLDAGEGTRWCVIKSGVPPHEVDRTLIEALRGIPGDGNAAHALQQAATTKYPCDH